MTVKAIVKKILKNLAHHLPMRKIILFESMPDYDDNTKAVFDELVKRGYNKKFKFIWVCHAESSVLELKNKLSYVDNFSTVNVCSKLCYYYRNVASAFIVCNLFLKKEKPQQYYIYLAHGCAFKNCAGHYSISLECADADIISLSEYLADYDAHNLNCNRENIKSLGFPRDDVLFTQGIDLSSCFPDASFDKFIYWLPTYRQHKSNDKLKMSNIAMPILYDEKIAAQVNECAEKNGVLILIKPHQAQDVSLIKKMNFSNLKFIDSGFLVENDIDNYQILAGSDALLSDYSSVYYDYLLCDKPIGLCWEDFEEYNRREGFTVDPDFIMKGGVKIYNVDDLCKFIKSVADGEDTLQKERQEIKNIVHNYTDGNSTKRVTDFVEEKITKIASAS